MLRLLTIIGARPQVIKAAPVSRALEGRVHERLVHTGQHHEPALADALIVELGLRTPDIQLSVHGGSHAEMLGRMLLALDPVLARERPDAVLVYGDTNSTLAGALAAAQHDIPVIHVEAGLRSFDPRMPEERNRLLTDRLARVCLCTSESAADQLRREDIRAQIVVVGDVMQDALLSMRARSAGTSELLGRIGVQAGAYAFATIHRAENTDDVTRLRGIVEALSTLDLPVVLPLHPRTHQALQSAGLEFGPNVRTLPPQSYASCMALTAASRCVITDSGGLQKEAYWLGIPCVTVRQTTEWGDSVTVGWNRLCAPEASSLHAAVTAAAPQAERPPIFGEPGASERIANLLSSMSL